MRKGGSGQALRVRSTTPTPIRIGQRQISHRSSLKRGNKGSEMYGGRGGSGMELLGYKDRVLECQGGGYYKRIGKVGGRKEMDTLCKRVLPSKRV